MHSESGTNAPGLTSRGATRYGPRSLFTFSLASLLIALTVVGILLGLKVNRVAKQKAAVGLILRSGGRIAYHYEFDAAGARLPEAEMPGPEWLRHLIGDDYFTTPAKVVIHRSNSLTDQDLETLKPLRELTLLQLTGGQITDGGMAHLEAFTDVQDLRIEDQAITGAGLVYLQNLPELTTLSLAENPISDVGARIIGGIGQLTRLNLAQTQVTDQGLQDLHNLKLLEQLAIVGCPVTEEGVRNLHTALPNCRITYGPSWQNVSHLGPN